MDDVHGSQYSPFVTFIFVSVVFMIEAMATANALIRLRAKGLFFNEWDIIIFYTTLIIYLIGDCVIYSTLVARSLALFFFELTSGSSAYDLSLGFFFYVSLPLCFFDFQKTKLLQMTTLAIRNISLCKMIVLSAVKLMKGGPHDSNALIANILALPNLFEGAAYSFMCHHKCLFSGSTPFLCESSSLFYKIAPYLPGIVTPMRDKSHLQCIVAFAFGSVIVVYLLLFVTSGLAFGLDNIMDPLTFNFFPNQYGFLGDCRFLFPACFTKSDQCSSHIDTTGLGAVVPKNTSLDTVASTLQSKNGHWQILLNLLAVVPPTILSYIVEHAEVSVDELVGFIGAFVGCALILIIPAFFVYSSRRIEGFYFCSECKEFAKAYTMAWNHQKPVAKPTTPRISTTLHLTAKLGSW